MNAPGVWIFLPLAAALGLWFLQRRKVLVTALATGLCLALAGLAYLLPFDETMQLGPLALRIQPAALVLGRQFTLGPADRPLLVFMYALGAFWLAGSNAAGVRRNLVPYGLGILALLVAAMAVEPVLYAALLVEGAVLFSIPMLVPPGQAPTQGVIRYLIFQTLAMPLFILGSWALAGANANPTDLNMVVLTGGMLGLGFALWLAVFPAYTWVPLLSGQAWPYTAGFVLLFLPTTCLLLGLGILGANGWLREAALLRDVLRISGGLMVVTAGAWAAFTRDLGRLLGYVAIVQTGFSLLALSLASGLGYEIFIMMFLPRVVALGLLSLSAAVLSLNSRSLRLEDLARATGRAPMAVVGAAVGFLSLAGLPLLAEFPIRFVLLQNIAAEHPVTALGVLLGSLGLLFSAFRLLAVTTGGSISPQQFLGLRVGETRMQFALIVFGIAALLVVGVAPRAFFPIMVGILPAFGIGP